MPVITPARINTPPSTFQVEVVNRTKNTALLEWVKAIDPDKDKVAYSVFLEGRKITTDLDSTTYMVQGLTPKTEYAGYVLAYDTQKDSTRSDFTFTTKSPYTTFSKYYPVPASKESVRSSFIIKTFDQGYVITGTTYSRSMDRWIMFATKIDSLGIQQWNIAPEHDIAGGKVAVTETEDRGLILAAKNIVLKLNAQGDVLWEKTLEIKCVINAVTETNDNSLYAVGVIGPDKSASKDIKSQAILVKLDAGGTPLWERRYGTSGYNTVVDVVQSPSGGFMLLCETGTSDNMDFCVMNTDAKGEIRWQRTYGDRRFDFAAQLKATSDGGYVMAGSSWGAYDFSEMRAIKIDAAGNELWNRSFNNGFSFQATAIEVTHDGGYALTGYTKTNSNDTFLVIYKLDSNGSKTWEHWYGRGMGGSFGSDLVQTPDKGYMVAGYSSFDSKKPVWVLKLDPEGNYDD
ncbi:hypothetical protein DXT99_25885 [Pontibacter diazotrophicus]|uniref:Fibronectin type-III domain-containing protein n=1 Tax=Pontibacter diazotrophicus TaxID=1400979 RepID=A0A3D8L090_9BACT|nr:hypothetical protein DXT99_25885 [Pontibacter diazotrophicus]